MHDRDIHIRTDDSVMRILPDLGPYPIRRSRGYAPFPVRLPWAVPPILAAGAHLKNTFCITNGHYAFLSHHIGDLENYETLQSFEQGIAHFEGLFRVKPEAIACDLHPDYLATRYALERAERDNLPIIKVQHHHAHIAALMAEHRLEGAEPVIGVSFDGTGYGDDGAIWGGEFLLADYAGYRRMAHLGYFPLPGGDAATRRPSRTALGLLHALGLDWDEALPTHADLCYEDRTAIRIQLERKLNSPLTSSMGRLFDAAAALAGVRQQVNYEAQAAIEFEALSDPDETGLYPFEFAEGQVNPSAAIEALIADVLTGHPVPQISARFHNGLAEMVRDVCASIRVETGVVQSRPERRSLAKRHPADENHPALAKSRLSGLYSSQSPGQRWRSGVGPGGDCGLSNPESNVSRRLTFQNREILDSIGETPMCLGIPAKIVEVYEKDGLQMAKVDFGAGTLREACLAYVPEAQVDEYVIIHVGFAISVLSEEEAQETLALLREMGAIEEELGNEIPD
jgi:hydrogenase assembly chaperone HypC/HupF